MLLAPAASQGCLHFPGRWDHVTSFHQGVDAERCTGMAGPKHRKWAGSSESFFHEGRSTFSHRGDLSWRQQSHKRKVA